MITSLRDTNICPVVVWSFFQKLKELSTNFMPDYKSYCLPYISPLGAGHGAPILLICPFQVITELKNKFGINRLTSLWVEALFHFFLFV